ncbi:MAG: response regulator [Alphaproteobacteria bacterium]|nr:response regulator [Alphaproteobacteria bacterium]
MSLWIVGIAAALGADPPAPRPLVDHWTTADGLPVDAITDVAPTADGLVWVATFDGLWAFDGQRFWMPPGAAELGSRLNSIAVHPDDGALWVAGEQAGVARLFEGQAERLLEAQPSAGDFVQDEDGLWLPTHDGLFRLGAVPERFAPERVRGRVAGTARGPDGSRWVGLYEGRVLRFRPDGAVDELGPEAGVPARLLSLTGLRDGGIWLFADHDRPDAGFQWQDGRFVPSPGSIDGPDACARQPWRTAALCPAEGPADSAWSASRTEVRHRGEAVLQLDDVARSAVVDARGDLWVGTRGDGLYRLREPEVGVLGTGQADDRVDMVWLSAAGEPWLRRYAGGWWTPDGLLPGSETSPQEVGPLSGAYLFRSDGALTAATHSGIVELSEDLSEGPAEARRSPRIRSVADVDCFGARAAVRDALGRSWVAGQAGLCVEEGGQWRRWEDAEGDSPGPLLAIAVLEDRSLVVARADGGLLRLTSESGREEIPGTEELRVRHLRLDRHVLWLSTMEHGLCALDLGLPPDRQAPHCAGLDEGLPARGAHQTVVDDRGRTWFSSNRGIGLIPTAELVRLAGGERLALHPLVLGVGEGMAVAEANGGTDHGLVLDERGRLWVATQQGAAFVDTRSFELPEPPAVWLRAITVGGEDVDPEALDLPEDPPPVTVRFAAPATRFQDQLRFRSRLNGGSWTEGAQPELSLAWLPPGPFAIEVQAGLGGQWGRPLLLQGQRAPKLHERAALRWLVPLLTGLAVALAALGRGALLRRRNRELEAIVAERTEVLRSQAAQLAQQADQLHDLDELRTRMIVNLHHELRTPLSLVLGPLRAEGDGLDPRLRLALRNAERLETLVGQLSEIARLEAGEVRLVAHPLPVAPILRRCVERYSQLAAERGQHLEIQPLDERRIAWVDAKLVDDALGNLVHNALKFSPDGGRVQVAMVVVDDQLRIEVRDQGPGVPERERRRIFERLYQSARGDDRPYEGSGLGLAIAREVVELHGGAIGCLPADGGGSCFWFSVPLGVGHVSPEQLDLERPAREVVVEEAPAGEGELVLIVEDHADMRAWLAAVLGEGFRVLTARDGAEGLAMARDHRPRVVVTDLMMPVMDGMALLRALRTDPALGGTPVVIVSAKTGQQERVAGLELADAWLAKPFHAPELRAHVARLARRVAPAAAGAAEPAEPDEPALPKVDQALLDRLAEAVDARLADAALTIEALARTVGMSRRTLQRELGRIAGVEPSTWVREHRLAAARTLLQEGGVSTVSEAAAAVGMSRAYFTRAYGAWCGRAPGEDLRRG